MSQPVESFANDCFPQPHQHGLRAGLLSLLQQSWLFFNLPEPAGAFRFLLVDTEDGKQRCTICSGIYRRGGRALEHIRTHLGHTPFSCIGGFHGCSWPSWYVPRLSSSAPSLTLTPAGRCFTEKRR